MTMAARATTVFTGKSSGGLMEQWSAGKPRIVSENQQGTANVCEKMTSSPSVAKPLEGWLHPSPRGSSLPTSRVRNRANPEGIPQQSPGLRATSYPGSTESGRTNPNGVACVGGERGHNPVGVETWFARYPRVARRLATLGWRTQSLWDCLQWHPGLVGNDKPGGEGRGQPCKGLATEGEAAIFSHTPAVPCSFSDTL